MKSQTVVIALSGRLAGAGADGETQATVGLGFRSRVADNMDFGIAYQWAVLSPEGLFDDRITVDVSYRW